MNMARIAMLVIWVCLLFLSYEVRGRHIVVSDLKRQLGAARENTIETIKTDAGDVFDCVEIYKQPGLAHPKLKDHIIQKKPTMFIKGNEQPFFFTPPPRSPARYQGQCQKGLVPIQRLELDKMLNESLPTLPEPEYPSTAQGDYKKYWATFRTREKLAHSEYTCCGQKLLAFGGGADINVFGVPDVGRHAVSSSLMWVINEDVGAILRTGWQVKPGRYNDMKSRVFIEWTADNDKTNCVDNDCPGFVVVSNAPALGAAFLPLSKYLGTQYVLPVFIYKDIITGHWWFAVGSKENVVGYWPREVFNDFSAAHRIDFGGYVSSLPNMKSPRMGNGVLPGAIDKQHYDHACFIRFTHFYSNTFFRVNLTGKITTPGYSDAICCTVGKFEDGPQSFTFGGPGF